MIVILYLVGPFSFAILIFGFLHFKKTVAKKIVLKLQISQYQLGDEVEYIMGHVLGRTEEGMLILEDIVGAKIVTDVKDNSLSLGTSIMLKGKIDENRIFKINT